MSRIRKYLLEQNMRGGPIFALEYGEMPLRCLTVIHIDPGDKLNKVQTAYPFIREGKPADLEIADKTRNDEFEAVLKCITRQGTSLSFFAPLYSSDPACHEDGQKYAFSLAALAYSLKKIQEREFTLTEEPALEIEKLCRQEEDPNADVADIKAVDYSFAGLRALLFRADDDSDAEFYTAVESVSYFSFEETEMCRMDVRFLLREGDELRTALYASENVLAGYRPEVGDLIQGDLWLQGYPVKPIDEDESWGARSREDTALQNFLFSDEYLSSLHVGVAALARSLMYGGWDMTLYENDGDDPAIPAYLIERDNRRINVWVRSYIEGQEPETVFTAEEMASFQKESREKGCEAACAVVLCKDVGKGYTFKILEREKLEKTLGSFSGLMLYQQKILPEERIADEARVISSPVVAEEHEEHPGREKLPALLAPAETPEEFYETFRTLSFDAVRAKLAVIRKERQGARREATHNDLFRDIFIRPGLCYRCRKDESLGAAYNYGKDRIERLFWRELVEAQRESWAKIRQPEFDSVDQIIRDNAVSVEKQNFASAILAGVNNGVIRRILERSLRIKKMMLSYGRQDTLKDILIDFVKSYCHLYNLSNNFYNFYNMQYDDRGPLYGYSDIPYTLYLPSSYNNPEMWRSYDLERHPENVVDLPLPFQLALLAECIKEGPPPIYYDAQGRGKEDLAPLLKDYDNPEHDLKRMMEAITHQDIGLFLKMLVRAWERDPSVVKDWKDEIQSKLETHRLLWALREYDLYVAGAYSGFEKSIPKNEALREWLLASFPLPDGEAFLKKGDVITNVVGMRHIPWEAYLDLDRYIGKGGFYLIRERDNPADANAVMAYLEGFGKTGYLKRPVAAMLAPLMERGIKIAAELHARHYPYYDQDMTLYLRLKEATVPLKLPDMRKKYRKRPAKKPEFVVVKEVSEQEKALNYAKSDLDDADRWLGEEIGHDRIPVKLHDAVQYAMEAWLHGQGIALDRGNGWHSMKEQFKEEAPDHLHLRVQSALMKVSLLQGQTSAFDAGWALKNRQDNRRRKWRWNITVAIKQIGKLIRLIEEAETLTDENV